MQIQKMKVLAEAGAVRTVEAMPGESGWVVWITYAFRSGERCEALERQRGGVRVFATLNAVTHCLAAAGVSRFQVNTAKPP